MHEDATLRLGVSRNLLIMAWSSTPESPQLRALTRAIASLATKHRHDCGTLNLVVAGIPRFTEEVRDELVKILRDPRHQVRASAHVVLTEGLAGVTTRAFLSTVTLLARSTTPHKVLGDVKQAATWMAPLLSAGSVQWSVDDIVAAQGEVTRAGAAASPGKPRAS